MSPRPCPQLLAAIQRVCAAEPGREACRAGAAAEAQRLAPHLPWIHRTGRTAPWRSIFAAGRLAPSEVKAHEALDERSLSVYFFVGACAYPKGNIVLVLRPEHPDWLTRATFAPFDTGSLMYGADIDRAHPIREAYAPWELPQRCQFLQDHSGEALTLGDYLPLYLATHFHRPADYVQRPQLSAPDLPPYHGLRSPDGDRRAWTVEVQLHGDAGAALDRESLLEIFVLGKDRFDALPAMYKGMARLLEEDDSDALEDPLAAASAEWTLRRAQETTS